MVKYLCVTILCFAVTACSESATSKYILFSPVSGTVFLNGVVAPNARIERKYEWRWGEESGGDNTSTDKQGRFSLPEITGRSWSAWLPHETYIRQTIDIFVDGKKYDVWGGVRRSHAPNQELEGKPIKIRIELASDIVMHANAAGRFTVEP